jgi:4-(gamma-glutamylamino)butanal dehydrogenase
MQTALRYIDGATHDGAALRLRGKRARVDSGGFFVEPTVFDKVAPHAALAREEVFGPVLAVTSFTEPDEAIRLANGTVYGLAAGLWMRDVSLAHRAAREIELGWSGSMAGTRAISPCRSAALSNPASAATARCTPYINMPT